MYIEENNIYSEYSSSESYEVAGGYNYYDDDSEELFSEPGKGMAITGLVFGIVALVFVTLLFCCMGVWGSVFGLPLSVAGIIISIIALKKGQQRNLCVTGVVCSAVAFVISLFYVGATLVAIFSTFFMGSTSVLDYFGSY